MRGLLLVRNDPAAYLPVFIRCWYHCPADERHEEGAPVATDSPAPHVSATLTDGMPSPPGKSAPAIDAGAAKHVGDRGASAKGALAAHFRPLFAVRTPLVLWSRHIWLLWLTASGARPCVRGALPRTPHTPASVLDGMSPTLPLCASLATNPVP